MLFSKGKYAVGETVPCFILDKQMGYFTTTIEMCFESARKESDSKTILYLFAEQALFSSPLMNSYQHASEMVQFLRGVLVNS